jgi:aryl-alcohol dehydrogenase-like predicted oxidoreductase
MKYKLLGKSGLKVSELSLGTMTFGEEWGWGSSKEESRKVFDAYVEAGGNFFDTANIYTRGTSEKFLGEFVGTDRHRYVLATKYTLNNRPDDPNAGGNHRKSMVQALEGSLRRLNTDYIDLYWVHAWDGITPLEEMMRALDDQVRLGKVLSVGFSDAPAWIVARANTLAELKGWTPFTGIQVLYNLAERTVERELLPMAKALDIGVAIWSPLAGGVLTGKYNTGTGEPRRFTPDNPRTPAFLNPRSLEIARIVMDIAKELHRPPSQVALNWLRQKKGKGVLIPIIGGRNAGQIRDNLACLTFELTAEQMAKLDQVSAVSLGFPHDFLSTDMMRSLIHGRTQADLEAGLGLAA